MFGFKQAKHPSTGQNVNDTGYGQQHMVGEQLVTKEVPKLTVFAKALFWLQAK